MNDLAKFFSLIQTVALNELLVEQAKGELKTAFSQLVAICPHSEAIEWNFTNIRAGITRICKICGVEDHASKGGTPGDEYDYGYPGTPDPSFWGDVDIEKATSEQHLYEYRRSHNWIVKKGKAVDRWA